jgi:UDP-N-acetylmuramyl pentapeptide synthase
MMQLSIGELASVVGGQLCLGALPPLAGEYEPVRRIVVECQEVAPGDVYWGLVRPGFDGSRLADTAFMRGALGVVVGGRHVEPWAGRFSIVVPDANGALKQLAQCLRAGECVPNRGYPPSRTSTQIVQDWFAGQPIDLDAVLELLPGGPDCVVA